MALIAPDKLQHLTWGAGLAVLLGGVLVAAKFLSPGVAIGLGQVALAFGVELYQKKRNEGTPSVGDAAFTAAPGVGLGAGTYFLG